MENVLVIEDSRAMQRALRRLLQGDSLEVQVASDGVKGLESFRTQVPSAVVLDLKVPGISGKELCRTFKILNSSVPIVVLSANSKVEEKVLLLELGADDYVTKPFSPRELLARVRRAMRRGSELVATTQSGKPHDQISFGDVRIDFTSMEVMRAGLAVTMSAQEFKVVRFFSKSPGRVISRDELLEEVWGYKNYLPTRTVDSHIGRLRHKLEPDPSNPRFFLTVHGFGFKFLPNGLSPLRGTVRRLGE